MVDKPLPRDKRLKSRSTELRNGATKQENHLWYDFLRAYPIHFYRQRIIGPYIVDFYCPTAKLVVELDGSQHFEHDGLEHDARRTQYLNSLGLRILRFSNSDVDRSFESVCRMIAYEIDCSVRE